MKITTEGAGTADAGSAGALKGDCTSMTVPGTVETKASTAIRLGTLDRMRQIISNCLLDRALLAIRRRLVIRHRGLVRVATITRNARKRVALAKSGEGFFLRTTRWIRRDIFLRISHWNRRDFGKVGRRSLKAAVKDCA